MGPVFLDWGAAPCQSFITFRMSNFLYLTIEVLILIKDLPRSEQAREFEDSVDQADLQHVFRHNVILLRLQFRHIPGAVDISSPQPIPSLGAQIDESIGTKVSGLGEDSRPAPVSRRTESWRKRAPTYLIFRVRSIHPVLP